MTTQEYEFRLEGYKEDIFYNERLVKPFHAFLTIPKNAAEITRMAADKLAEQLYVISPDMTLTVSISSLAYNGQENVALFPGMILIRLDYKSTESRFLAFSFSLNPDKLVLV